MTVETVEIRASSYVLSRGSTLPTPVQSRTAGARSALAPNTSLLYLIKKTSCKLTSRLYCLAIFYICRFIRGIVRCPGNTVATYIRPVNLFPVSLFRKLF